MNPNKTPPKDMQKVFREKFVKQSPGRVLVVGSKLYPTRPDWRTWQPDGVGVDMEDGDGVDVVYDFSDGPMFRGEGAYMPPYFAHVECMSVLEHTQRPWIVAAAIEGSIEVGGSIFLSVPWVFNFHGYPTDLWRFSHLTFPILFPSIDWKVIRYAHGEVLTESERSPKTGKGLLPKTQVMGFGVKCES